MPKLYIKVIHRTQAKERRYSQGSDSKYRLSRQTVCDMRMYANLIFTYAIKHEYILKNPMEFAEIPKRDVDFMYTEHDRTEQRMY